MYSDSHSPQLHYSLVFKILGGPDITVCPRRVTHLYSKLVNKMGSYFLGLIVPHIYTASASEHETHTYAVQICGNI